MQTETFLYLIIAGILGLSIAYFQYYYKSRERIVTTKVLFGLRSLSVFLLILLLVNPSIEKEMYSNEKPVLSVLLDNSSSISYFRKHNIVSSIQEKIKLNKRLNEKFDIVYYRFDENINIADSLDFNGTKTDIFKALETAVLIDESSISPIVLISDGNQTKGKLYPYISTKKNIFPVVIGDTLPKIDLKITRVNSNKYSYLNNKSPIECTIVYEGKSKVASEFALEHNGKIIYKEKLSLDTSKNSKTIATTVKSNKVGVQFYKASIRPITKEFNIKNNQKSFSIEVFDQQTKILLISAINHPDIGAIKRSIETNKQRSVTIVSALSKDIVLEDYQLVILYQPDSSFKNVFDKVKSKQVNYFVITGTKTDWGYLNKAQINYSKNFIAQTELYGAELNTSFLSFNQKELDFNTFPPLKDVFGEINYNTKFDALLTQDLSGISTEHPLFAFFENSSHKSAVLLGENSWKWRAASFINNNSFKNYDEFISNVVQYLASTTKRERLVIDYKKVFDANETVVVKAHYMDKNFKFDSRAQLSLHLSNLTTNTNQRIPFSLVSNSFTVEIDGLSKGKYSFEVLVDEQALSKHGDFTVSDYDIEKQFSNADAKNLKMLASNTNGKIFLPEESNQLTDLLIADKRYYTTQSVVVEKINLIEWTLILLLLILSLSIEWFVRKYYGKL